MTYFSQAQVDKLLEPLNPGRVSKLKKAGREFSYMEAYELRAALSRLLGFGRWSQDVLEQELLYETDNGGKWTVGYRSLVRLTVCAPDGTVLCTYTEGATGEAINQPSRGDAHDLALKSSQSGAFKRCCVNLGDYGGVSLYQGGRTLALVAKTLVYPFDGAAPVVGALDAHVTEVIPEDEYTAPVVFETNGSGPVAPDPVLPGVPWRDLVLAPVEDGVKPNLHYAKLTARAAKEGALNVMVEDRQGTPVTVKRLIDAEADAVRA